MLIFGLSPIGLPLPQPIPALNPKSFDCHAPYRLSLASQDRKNARSRVEGREERRCRSTSGLVGRCAQLDRNEHRRERARRPPDTVEEHGPEPDRGSAERGREREADCLAPPWPDLVIAASRVP